MSEFLTPPFGINAGPVRSFDDQIKLDRNFLRAVIYLMSDKEFPSPAVNKLMSSTNELIENQQLPLFINGDQDDSTVAFGTVVYQQQENTRTLPPRVPCFTFTPHLSQLATSDPAQFIGDTVRAASLAKDYFSKRITTRIPASSEVRATAYESEALLAFQEKSIQTGTIVDFTSSQLRVMHCFPQGIRGLIFGFTY